VQVLFLRSAAEKRAANGGSGGFSLGGGGHERVPGEWVAGRVERVEEDVVRVVLPDGGSQVLFSSLELSDTKVYEP